MKFFCHNFAIIDPINRYEQVTMVIYRRKVRYLRFYINYLISYLFLLMVTHCLDMFPTENPCVDSSILSWPTIKQSKGLRYYAAAPFLKNRPGCPQF